MATRRRKQAERTDAATRKVLRASLGLFARQGYRATSMRQIARRAGLSVGNLYHHFGGKERIFQMLIDEYWRKLTDPDLPLNRIFAARQFPEDIEQLAAAIEQVVEDNAQYILLIYVDVIEFRGEHIRTFYEGMATRFDANYGKRFAERPAAGEIGDVDPTMAVMVASRWFFYFFTVEKCFGVPGHFGMTPGEAVGKFIHLLRYGLLPRADAPALPPARPTEPRRGAAAKLAARGRRATKS
jgi:TetR/AcrR family transcriptional regulator, acrAB operon repressor